MYRRALRPPHAFRRGCDGLVHALTHLEDSLSGGDVLQSWRFHVKGVKTGSNGVLLTVDGGAEIIGPAPAPARQKIEDDGDNYCDDHDLVCLAGSDIEDNDVKVVDTDAETDDASGNESDDSGCRKAKACLKPAPAPAAISTIAVAREVAASHRRPRKQHWSDDYFYVYDSTKTFLTIFIRS